MKVAKQIDRDLQFMVRTLRSLDKTVRNRIMRKANRDGLQVAVDAAQNSAFSGKYDGEGAMAENITQAKGKGGGPYKIINRMGVEGGASAPSGTTNGGIVKGSYRASKTRLSRRPGENRWGLTGFSSSEGATYYWRFVEFGTSKMPARPFLRPAFEGSRSGMWNVVKRETRRGINRAALRLRKR